MPIFSRLNDRQYVFGSLLMIANRLGTLLDRALTPVNLTSVQWFLLVVVGAMFDRPPTVKELARMLSTSHQNVKQVALRLAGKGLLQLVKDPQDRRVTRIGLTEDCRSMLASIDARSGDFLGRLLVGVDPADLATTRRVLQAVQANARNMEQALTQAAANP